MNKNKERFKNLMESCEDRVLMSSAVDYCNKTKNWGGRLRD